MRQHNYYVYIMANQDFKLYLGVTRDVTRRVWEHKAKINPKSFTAQNNIVQLVYYEHFTNINDAIQQEKRLKNWHREWKLNLIKEHNPHFEDLSKEW